MLLPASTGSGESDLVSARLAEVLTVVSSVAVLSERSEEHTSELESAEQVVWRVLEETNMTTRLTDLFAQLVIVVRCSHLSVTVMMLPPVSETKFVPAVTTSDYTLSLHYALPIFVTVSV